jgi:heat shock protein HslJ/uncharacterized membrane protein
MIRVCVCLCGFLLLVACRVAEDPPPPREEAAVPAQTDATDETLPNQQFLLNLWQEGVDFYARGNEPFWGLDLDFDREFRLMETDGVTLKTPAAEGVKARDADVTRYVAKTDSGSLVITITAQKCSDTMADEDFSHRVEVVIERGGEEKTFVGCGRYVPDYSLNDIWVLTHLDGEAIDGTALTKGLPTMELHMAEGRVVGHGGCNNFMGSFAMEWKTIRFGDLASTMMACPDMSVETAFLKAISGRSLTYESEDLLLVLSSEDGTQLKFKKVD